MPLETKDILLMVAVLGTITEAIGLLLLIGWAGSLESTLFVNSPYYTYPAVIFQWTLPLSVLVIGWIMVGVCSLVVLFTKKSEK